MERIGFEAVDDASYDDLHADRRVLTEALGATELAIARYVLAPGDRLSGAVHAHPDQEEVFVVLAGEVTFETGREPDGSGTVRVGTGEVVRFAPGEFQSGRNAGDERAVVLALGAPRDAGETRVARIPVLDDYDVECPGCGRGDLRFARDGDVTDDDLVCPDCGETLTPG